MTREGQVTLRRTSLVEQAADELAGRIEDGEWAVGDALPGEHALAADLGVGRSTVREAVRALVSRGLVRARQGAGVFVTSATPSTDWTELLRRSRVADVVEARIAVEVEAARLAAARRTTHDVDALRDALAVRAATDGSADDDAYVEADSHVHASLVAASHNLVLVELFAALAPRVRVAMVELLAVAGPNSVHRHDQPAHVAIVDAVVAGDAAAAAAAARDHLQSLLDALEPAPGPAAEPEETR